MGSQRELREKAERYRQLVSRVTDLQALEALYELIARYEALAASLETSSPTADDPASGVSDEGEP
jgi:hypothetical protein